MICKIELGLGSNQLPLSQDLPNNFSFKHHSGPSFTSTIDPDYVETSICLINSNTDGLAS